MEEEMKFISYIKPSLPNGTYTIRAVQSVTSPENCEFEEQKTFDIAGHAFHLPAEEVFSTCPADNETGEFGDMLPFVVLDNRTFPWENSICPEKNGVPVPWVALLVISEGEGAEEKDIQVGELLGKTEEGVYYPDRAKLPGVFAEKETDTCHVVDLPTKLYGEVMPSMDDLPYLCHARRVNLKRTEDSVCARDGFFSVVCGNRFIPSKDGTPAKSTVHLVSLLGMGDLTVPAGCKKVRLVSLYHWDVFSQKKSGENFAALIRGLQENCGIICDSMDTDLKRQGYSVKRHMTRTGEQTYSLYRPPLVPFLDTETLEMGNKHTADGRLIYDRENGIFDITYAAAWQLGRMLALSRPADAEKITQFRKTQKLRQHQSSLKASMDFQKIDMKKVADFLAGKNVWGGGSCDEKDTAGEGGSKVGGSVFRGYC